MNDDTTGEAPCRLDGRTRMARRIKQLTKAYLAALAGPSPVQVAQIKRAAEMTALAEQARAKRMAGDESVSWDDVVRLDSAARRAVRDLKLPAKPEARESMTEYLARTAREGAR
jgi:hypothetical protein